MYLTIPSKEDVDLISKAEEIRPLRKVITHYDSIEGFSAYSPYSITLKDPSGTTDIPSGTVYNTSASKVQSSYGRDYVETMLVANASDIEAKGTLDGITPTGEKVMTLGKCFLHDNSINVVQTYAFIPPESLIYTGEKTPISIREDQKIYGGSDEKNFYAKVLYNKVTGKKIVALKSEDGKLVDARPEEINSEAIRSKKIIILEERPIRWLIDGDKAITIDRTLISSPPVDYQNSNLKATINSSLFQETLGFGQVVEQKRSKNPFRVGDQTLDQQLKKAIRIGIIPFLVGPPGVGKTEIVESQSKHVLRYNMARFTPTSFTGKDYVIPGDTISYTDESGKTVTHTEKALTGSSEPVWLQEVKQALEEAKEDGEDVILFLDEFDKLTPPLQVFINGIIDENPTLGGWPVPKGVKIVLAGNTTVDSLASNKISSEVSSRLMTINVRPNLDEWIRWAIKSDIDPMVIAYLKIHPEDLLTTIYGPDGRPDPSLSMNPRKWAKMVSKELKESRLNGSELMLRNYMSEEQVEEFMGFIDEYYDNYIEEILNDEAPLHITEDVGRNSFIVTILSVITKIEQLRTVLKTIQEKEFKKMFIVTWVGYHPQYKTEAYEIIQEIKLEEEGVRHGY